MITTVTLNPAIDRTLTLDTLRTGEVNRIKAIREDMGGKGINVSKVLNALEIPTIATGMIGSRNLGHVETLLSEAGINHDFVCVDATTRTNTKIVDLSQKNTTDLNEPGFAISNLDLLELIERLKKYEAHSDYIVLSGRLPKGCPSDTYRFIQNQFSASVRFVLDADLQAFYEGIKAGPYLIKPNLNELCEAFEVVLRNDEEIVDFTRKLIHDYKITLVLLSMGVDGSMLITKDEAYRSNSLSIDPKSTVGAGDSMLAGCLFGLMNHLPLKEVLRIASVCGSLACTMEGTEAFSKAEVYSRLDEITISSIQR